MWSQQDKLSLLIAMERQSTKMTYHRTTYFRLEDPLKSRWVCFSLNFETIFLFRDVVTGPLVSLAAVFRLVTQRSSLWKTDFFPDEIPDPDELSEGTLVLVKDAKSDFFRDGKIVQIGDSLYMEPKVGAPRRFNVKELRVKKEPKFCPP